MAAAALANHTAAIEVVAFTVAGQSFCLEIMQIREIRRWVPVTALPHAAADVLGVMNLRGTVIPILDLAVRFGLGRSEPSPRSVVIIVSVEGHTVGLMVESVSEILTVPQDRIRDTPDMQSSATRQCIQGLIPIEGGMTRIINLRSVIEVRSGVSA
jgi:purine-binding chemotaxis protein CheW